MDVPGLLGRRARQLLIPSSAGDSQGNLIQPEYASPQGAADAATRHVPQQQGETTGTLAYHHRDKKRTPVLIMLPLDTVTASGFTYANQPWFSQALQLLAHSGAYGVAVDVWWGAVEREPRSYNWSGYKQLFEVIKQTGLKAQVVLGFHACGSNVGDNTQIPLPSWVLQCGEHDPDLFFTDRPRGGGLGQRNREYLSIWADDAPGVLLGRSPMQCYEDFMVNFRDVFQQELGILIEEVLIGSGPCGELRYPSYVEAHGWRFPGVGEFQCYDRRALASLAQAAREAGKPDWGYGGPHNAGDYCSNPEDTEFFAQQGSWDTQYGRFFLHWYSNSLLRHGEQLMSIASRTFAQQTRHKHRHHHHRRHHHHHHHPHHHHPSQQQQQQQQPGLWAGSTGSPPGGSSPRGASPLGGSPPGGSPLAQRMRDAAAAASLGRRPVPVSTWQPLAAGATAGLQGPGLSGASHVGPAAGVGGDGEKAVEQDVGAAGCAQPVGAVTPPSSVLGFDEVYARSCSSLSGKLEPASPQLQPPPQPPSQRLSLYGREGGGGARAWGRQLSSSQMSDTSATAVPHSPHTHMGGGTGSSSPHLLAGRPVSMTLVNSSSRPATDPHPPHHHYHHHHHHYPNSSSSSIAGGVGSLGPAGSSGLLFAGGASGGSSVPLLHNTSLPLLLPGSRSVDMPAVALQDAPRTSGLSRNSMGGPLPPGRPPCEAGSEGGGPEGTPSGTGLGARPLWAHNGTLSLGNKARVATRSSGNLAAACGAGGKGGGSSAGGGDGGAGTQGQLQASACAGAVGAPMSGAALLPPSLGGCSSSHNLLYSSLGGCSSTGNISNSSAGGSMQDVQSLCTVSAAPLHGEEGSLPSSNTSAPQAGDLVAGLCAEAAQLDDSPRPTIHLAIKVAGIHWWYQSRSHAAELTAGYYNTAVHDGYAPIVDMCAQYGVGLTLTCVEMCDGQHPLPALCGPEGLLKQLRCLAARAHVPLSGENALPIFLPDGTVDSVALERIVLNARAWGGASAFLPSPPPQLPPLPPHAHPHPPLTPPLLHFPAPPHHLFPCHSVGSQPIQAAGLASQQQQQQHPSHPLPHSSNAASTQPPAAAEGGGGGKAPACHLMAHACIAQPPAPPYALAASQTQGHHAEQQQQPLPGPDTPPCEPHAHNAPSIAAGAQVQAQKATRGGVADAPGSWGGCSGSAPSVCGSAGSHSHGVGGVPTYLLQSGAEGGGWTGNGTSLSTGGHSMLGSKNSSTDVLFHLSCDGAQQQGQTSSSLLLASRSTLGGGGGCSNGGLLLASRSSIDTTPARNSMEGLARCVAATGLKPNSYSDLTEPLPALHSFTFLRLGPELLQPSHQTPWLRFMLRMQHEQDLM